MVRMESQDPQDPQDRMEAQVGRDGMVTAEYIVLDSLVRGKAGERKNCVIVFLVDPERRWRGGGGGGAPRNLYRQKQAVIWELFPQALSNLSCLLYITVYYG